MRLDELAGKIGAELAGDGSIDVTAVATLENAQPGQLSFVSNPKYAKQLQTTDASAAVVGLGVKSDRLALLKAKNPYYVFRQAVVLLHGFRKHPHTGVHPSAFIDPTATIGQGTVVYPGCVIGPRVKIGKDCILYPNVNVYDECVIGDRVIVHAGATLGVDGFGFATEAGVHHKIPQIGNLIIEDDVEIGACSAIERGALGSTIIGRGTKIDNSVVVGHGTTVGEHCIFVAQVGIAGSVTIGHHVVLGGQTGVAGHLSIGDGAMVGAKGGVLNDVAPKEILLGAPVLEARRYRRAAAVFKNLPELLDRVKKLEQMARVDEDQIDGDRAEAGEDESPEAES
jgi:UDP-3-O-[3-hydroxymyristoyl] glucosamine N-acyltransferase